MKTDLVQTEETNDYPLLKISEKGNIVLFIKPKTGVFITNTKGNNYYRTGSYSDTWNEPLFTPFKGKVELEND